MTIRPALTSCSLFIIGGLMLHGSCSAVAAGSPFDLDVKELDRPMVKGTTSREPRSKPVRSIAPKSSSNVNRTTEAATPSGEYSRYTIKPGDFIYRILVTEYGLSTRDAERLIPEIIRINAVSNIRNLKVGQVLLIPLPGHPTEHQPQAPAPAVPASPPETTPEQSVRPAPEPLSAQPARPSEPPAESASSIAAPVTPPSTQEPPQTVHQPSALDTQLIARLQNLWSRIVPSRSGGSPIIINGTRIDPILYPQFPAPAGGTIILDPEATMPPQLRQQILSSRPDIRIVETSGNSSRELFSSLIAAAGYARVEEKPAITFGSEPQLTVRPDFKVTLKPGNRGSERPLLVNISDSGPCFPVQLKNYLSENGFQVVESCDDQKAFSFPGLQLYQITTTAPCDTIRSLLEILSVRVERNRIIDGRSGGENGRFSIRVDGYFDWDGQRFIVSCSGQDPYNYTLLRLLETEGYGILALRDDESFASTVRQLFSLLKIDPADGRHEIAFSHYTVSIPGILVAPRSPTSPPLLIINRKVDPLFSALLTGK